MATHILSGGILDNETVHVVTSPSLDGHSTDLLVLPNHDDLGDTSDDDMDEEEKDFIEDEEENNTTSTVKELSSDLKKELSSE